MAKKGQVFQQYTDDFKLEAVKDCIEGSPSYEVVATRLEIRNSTLSLEQVRLLDLLSTKGALTFTEITELQGGHKSATSNRLKKLIQKNYVQFEQKENDHRIKHVVITVKGLAATKLANELSYKYL
ncbi:MarR family transcriptional regulator [Paenibacillus glacialis]|uniref:HTH marR-type domain-containing protein n=1 Tax=Paenibacillus glacialis TaxID=494026 RepID=A0A168JIZ3_9BACL|nr:MarR family transcriptional regulator [Paenibacillus glacialis]OAB40695.1 hypothetical protein PGLA_18010 [Paenibacillus glacialis]